MDSPSVEQPVNSAEERPVERPLPPPNPVTQAAHQRETLLQITMPAVIGLLLFVVVVLLAILASAAEATRWGQVATIFLSALMLIMTFVGLIILAGLAYAIYALNQAVPPRARLLQDYTDKARYYARLAADKAVEPVLAAQAGLAAVSRFFGRKSGNG